MASWILKIWNSWILEIIVAIQLKIPQPTNNHSCHRSLSIAWRKPSTAFGRPWMNSRCRRKASSSSVWERPGDEKIIFSDAKSVVFWLAKCWCFAGVLWYEIIHATILGGKFDCVDLKWAVRNSSWLLAYNENPICFFATQGLLGTLVNLSDFWGFHRSQGYVFRLSQRTHHKFRVLRMQLDMDEENRDKWMPETQGDWRVLSVWKPEMLFFAA